MKMCCVFEIIWDNYVSRDDNRKSQGEQQSNTKSFLKCTGIHFNNINELAGLKTTRPLCESEIKLERWELSQQPPCLYKHAGEITNTPSFMPFNYYFTPYSSFSCATSDIRC